MKKAYVAPCSEGLELAIEAIIAASVPMHTDNPAGDDFMELGNEKNFDWE